MITEKNKKSIKEIIQLNHEQMGLFRDFKKIYKKEENFKYKYSKTIKDSLKDLIFDIESPYALELVKKNKWDITGRMPNPKREKHLDDLYIKMINLINYSLNYREEYRDILVESSYRENPGLFELIKHIPEIKMYIDDSDIFDLFNILKSSNEEQVLKSALLILEMCDGIKDKEIVRDLIKLMKNPKKIETTHKFIQLNRHKTFDKEYKDFVKIIINKIKERDNQLALELFLTNLYRYNHIEAIYKSRKEIIFYLLDTIMTKNSPNLELLVDLIKDPNYIKLESFDIQKKIIDVLSGTYTEIVSDELFLEIISKVVIPCKNEKMQLDILDKLQKIHSRKSLNIILDLYPFIDKYSLDEKRVEIFDELNENLDNKNEINGKEKIKKLVIPIKYNKDEI